MSDFEQTCSQDDAYFAPLPQTCDVPESYATEPQATEGPYATGGVPPGDYSAFDHYAEDPEYLDDEDGQCIDPSLVDEPEPVLDEDGECIDPGPDVVEPPEAKPRKEMSPEEKAADKQAKLEEYATQSLEEKQARWAKSDGKLSEEAWEQIQKLPEAERNQAMLQAGIEKLDYDDPRRAQLEKIQRTMDGKNSRTGGAYATGTPQTGCGGTVDEMLKMENDPSQKTFPGYIAAGKREAPVKGELGTPKAGDVFELTNSDGDTHGHAGTFCVASPDGKTWLTYDGGQQAKTSDKQEIKLVTRRVSVNDKGQTIVSGPSSMSGNAADNNGRALSGTYDFQTMYDKYPALHPPAK